MKHLKKLMAIGLTAAMVTTTFGAATALAAGDSKEVSGSHVFMFKSVGNAFGVIMYDGFSSYMEQVGENCI